MLRRCSQAFLSLISFLINLSYITWSLKVLLVFRDRVGRGYIVRIPGEPEKVYPRNQNGFRRIEKEKRARTTDSLSQKFNQLKRFRCKICFKLFNCYFAFLYYSAPNSRQNGKDIILTVWGIILLLIRILFLSVKIISCCLHFRLSLNTRMPENHLNTNYLHFFCRYWIWKQKITSDKDLFCR